MTNLTNPMHCWRTASDGRSADTLPADLSALGEHLNSCQSTHRHILALHCATQAARRFMAARFFTTVVLAVAILGVTIWIF